MEAPHTSIQVENLCDSILTDHVPDPTQPATSSPPPPTTATADTTPDPPLVQYEEVRLDLLLSTYLRPGSPAST
jgi:hypothetical protein